MSTSTISLKSINDLLQESFLIPAYQRGYRWTQQQVVELLEDVMGNQKMTWEELQAVKNHQDCHFDYET